MISLKTDGWKRNKKVNRECGYAESSSNTALRNFLVMRIHNE